MNAVSVPQPTAFLKLRMSCLIEIEWIHGLLD